MQEETNAVLRTIGWGVAFLAVVFAAALVDRLIWSRRLLRRMEEHDSKRRSEVAKRVAWLGRVRPVPMSAPTGESYPFADWAKLLEDGGVIAGERAFAPGEAVHVSVRDRANILRARVDTEPGSGALLIDSHGGRWRASFGEGRWHVEPANQPVRISTDES